MPSQLPDEAKTLDALRGVTPGFYFFPSCAGTQEMGSPEMQEKYKRGPVGLLTVMPSRPPTMPKHLALWLGFTLLVGIFVAYLAGRTLDPGSEYLTVFRVAGTTALPACAMGEITGSIWKGQPWGNTLRALIDGVVYALLTAGVFAWRWPA